MKTFVLVGVGAMVPGEVTIGDDMGPYERAWRVAGYAVVLDPAFVELEVSVCVGEVPILCVGPAVVARLGRDETFGLAMMELSHQSLGWLGLLRRLRQYHYTPRTMEEAG